VGKNIKLKISTLLVVKIFNVVVGKIKLGKILGEKIFLKNINNKKTFDKNKEMEMFCKKLNGKILLKN
jgi:hypothetical protein